MLFLYNITTPSYFLKQGNLLFRRKGQLLCNICSVIEGVWPQTKSYSSFVSKREKELSGLTHLMRTEKKGFVGGGIQNCLSHVSEKNVLSSVCWSSSVKEKKLNSIRPFDENWYLAYLLHGGIFISQPIIVSINNYDKTQKRRTRF